MLTDSDKTRISFVLLPALVLLAHLAWAVDVPYLTGRVVDNAEILSAETRQILTEQLSAHERATTNQVAVLTVLTIGDVSIEEYALEVFNTWQLGRKGQDNGVLIVVAPNERRMRIEVGYGLEGTLTDVFAGRIIRDLMTPRFKEADFNGGIADGVHAVVAILDGDTTAVPAPSANESQDSSGGSGDSNFSGLDIDWPMRILLGAFIFGVLGLFTGMGLLTPGMGWFLYFFLIPFWAMFPMVVVGTTGALWVLGTYIIGFPIAKLFISRSDWHKKAAKDIRTKGRANVGGWAFRSGSSGSGGGGGFSGGGGRSGGGGASGRW